MATDLRSERLPLRVFFYVGLGALAVRLLYLTQHARSPFFGFPVLDELYYDRVATLLLEGGSLAGINPGFRPLLYPWLLAMAYAASPEGGQLLVVVFQHLLGVTTAVLTVWLALRLGSDVGTAACGGVLFLLAGPPLFFEGELLNTTLMTLLATASAHLLIHLKLDRRDLSGAGPALAWGGAGAFLGLAAQARPNVLLVVLAFPLSSCLMRGASRRQRLVLPLYAVLGCVAALGLFATLQARPFGGFHLLPGSGGVNLYLGNKRGADGMIPRQDRAVTYGDTYRDSVQVFAREEYVRSHPEDTAPSAGEVSRYWLRRTGDEIAASPLAWLGLMARKLWLLAWNYEVPNNKSYAFALAEGDTLLRWLPVRWWLLLSLAPLGVVHLRGGGRDDALFWLLAFIALWALGLIAFFVNSRYRIPLWPLLCPLAAAGLRHLQAARGLALGRSLGTVLVLALVSLLNWPGIERPNFSRDYLFRSMAYLETGEVARAAADARRAAELEPREPAIAYQLGAVALAEERYTDAIAALQAALRLKTGEPRTLNALGAALEGQGLAEEAYAHYLEALKLHSDFTPAMVNAALLELRAGRTASAARRLERAAAQGDRSVSLLCAEAFLRRHRGEEQEAAALLEEARRRNPAAVDRLVSEHAIPLELRP